MGMGPGKRTERAAPGLQATPVLLQDIDKLGVPAISLALLSFIQMSRRVSERPGAKRCGKSYEQQTLLVFSVANRSGRLAYHHRLQKRKGECGLRGAAARQGGTGLRRYVV